MRSRSRSHRRRRPQLTPTLAISLGLAVSVGLAGCVAAPATETAGTTSVPADRVPGELVDDRVVTAIARELFTERRLKAAVGQVLQDGEVIAEFQLGEAMTGEDATLDASFRNGAVAIAYIGVALLRLHQRGVLDMDAPVAEWMPELPDSDLITPRQLITMTSGIPDYVPDTDFQEQFFADPYQAWTAEQLLGFGLAQPRTFAPGENWDYSHSGIVALGEIMSRAADAPLAEILRDEVLEPAGLTRTVSEQTAAIPSPYLHGFDAERGVYEDATFWNPSWTLAEGAVQTSTIPDVAKSFDAIIGRGELLEPESWAELISNDLVGFGTPLEGCRTCHTLNERYAYSIGVVLRGDWISQNPLFGGYAASVLTLPATTAEDGSSLTVAVAVTFHEDAIEDWTGTLPNRADELATMIATELRPDQAPPAFTFG